ncbi:MULTISPECIES: ABC transporter permease [Catellatospora]|uniref:ABC transporter permease n=2 Tax=Catellatospora TaxID=53365 RepID=A0A8J3P3X1_9ACTN|nr:MULTISPECIES: ABC transporter permease subunit [Catellatospora]RKE06167.1 ABC-2 type transport system permease protein [Catellatospora citrea]GIF88249.1 ABC transporter permease [Catellatospora chokoriensis]GIG00506.1 ABC transporter permease [Catellatospora citrea]
MNMTIAWITARGLLGRRRSWLLLPMPLILIGVTAVGLGFDAPAADLIDGVLIGLGVAVILPLVSLIVGTGVLGSEIDDGTVVHILTKPIPRSRIILAKLVVAATVSAVTIAVPMFVAATMIGGAELGLGFALACVAGAIAYSALFLALSVVTRRPVLVGLLYVVIWEGLLSNLVAGTRTVSVQHFVIKFAAELSGSQLFTTTVSTAVAAVMTVVFTVLGTWLATQRLRSFSVAGETS